jgi:hypothetical protein
MRWDHHTEKEALNVSFVRCQSRFLNVIQELEAELQRIKEKKLSDELINAKDLQIENLVSFYNQVDEFVEYYKLALANARIENHFLTEILLKKISLNELLEYKPSSKIIVANLGETESITISKING